MKSHTNAMRATFWTLCAAVSSLLWPSMPAALAQPRPYAPGVIIAQYRSGVAGARQTIAITPQHLLDLQDREAKGTLEDEDVPHYTSDTRTNRALLAAGVLRSQRLFASAKLRLSGAFRLTIYGQSVQSAIARLRAASGVASVTPDWYVSPMGRSSLIHHA